MGSTRLSQHIIIRHCDHAEDYIDSALKKSLAAAFADTGYPVNTTWCPDTGEDEVAAFAHIVENYADPTVARGVSMRNALIAIDPVHHGAVMTRP